MTTANTDNETWEMACEYVDVWESGLRCNGSKGYDQIRNQFGVVGIKCRVCDWIGGYVEVHHIPCPPLNDPAAAMSMLEWMAAEIEVPMRDDDTGEIVQVPDRRGLLELWFDEDYLWHCRPFGYCDVARHRQCGLAIAAAVCALKEPQNAS